MGEKNGVWEDNDSETLEHKTATEMPTLRDREGRDMAGCSQEPLRKALDWVQEHTSPSPASRSYTKVLFCCLVKAKPAISNKGFKPKPDTN